MPKWKKAHVKHVGRAAVPVRKIEGTAGDPEWVISMHKYYGQTGSYRTSDLDRVLGDPRKQVSGETPIDFEVACRLEGK